MLGYLSVDRVCSGCSVPRGERKKEAAVSHVEATEGGLSLKGLCSLSHTHTLSLSLFLSILDTTRDRQKGTSRKSPYAAKA